MRAEKRSEDSPERILGDLIRIRSDTGSDMSPVVECAAAFLERLGLAVGRFSFSPAAPCLVARYPGTPAGGAGRKALVLYCHLDTAPFDPDEWRVDPLGAVEVKGRIFGRGALDCKGLAAVWMSLLSRYARDGRSFPFDLAFVAVTDEEAQGDAGLSSLLRETHELDGAFLALGEGGGFPLESGGHPYYTIQTGEMVEETLPEPATAPRPPPFLATVAAGLRRGAYTRETIAYALRSALRRGKEGSRRLEHSPLALQFEEDGRLYRAEFPNVRGGRTRARPRPASRIETGSPGGSAIGLAAARRALRGCLPGARLLPLVTAGRSDNRHFRAQGIPALGFFPLDPANSIAGMHGRNEYITIDSLRLAERVLDGLIRDLAGTGRSRR